MSTTYFKDTDQKEILANMVEIEFVDSNVTQGFRVVKETLERMGISSNDKKKIYQSAHLFHKQAHYYICHFKELFAMDGKEAELTDVDLGRRNLIVKYLKDWNLVKPVSYNWLTPLAAKNALKVIKYSDKEKWELVTKYYIGAGHRHAVGYYETAAHS